ncbi:septal ring lytic transglycosylase RlpA family protein [Hyphomicrobium methylovorum]|uniref:septal ring lytic transglycosylase RlpA family protein n=1 Tax=Hyphomicrobium methylovorum TaxID=84 RepID=UPI0015E6C492|nr:septal ring lytic transglycosylase RlpA family protein [Hyphomicrobium methylovorum]MBA2124754.1 septal ring lytic transglycosylase RlpA family protein [Hyphomicrobium methylovorum]
MSRGPLGRLTTNVGLAMTASALLTACSSNPPARTIGGVSRPVFTESEYGVSTSPRVAPHAFRKGGGHYKLGSPYKVAGRWYVPHEDPNYQASGVASWYGDDFHGRRTANGEVFDARALTAAHPTMPLPSYAVVTNLDNGKSVLVRVNDRGPYVNDRIIDMSHAAASQLGYVNKGRARVRVQYAGRAPLNGDDRREREYLFAQQRQQPQQWQRPNRAPLPPMAVASAREAPPQRYDTNARQNAQQGGWSALGYRAGLAGKPPPQRSAAAPMPRPAETASLGNFDDRRMPYAPRETAAPFGSGRSYVQVGIFRERSNAERMRRELGALGPVEVAPISSRDGGQAYRVRIGPFSPDAAGRTQNQIADLGVSNTAIVAE